jgi:hypothetical protein
LGNLRVIRKIPQQGGHVDRNPYLQDERMVRNDYRESTNELESALMNIRSPPIPLFNGGEIMILSLAMWAFIAIAVAAFAAAYLVLRIRNAHREAELNESERAEEEEAYRLAKARLIYRRQFKQEQDDPLKSIFGVETPTHLRMR